MSEAGIDSARPLPSELVEGLYPHNAHVLAGYDPLPLQLPEHSPRLHTLAASHGAYGIRLQSVAEELATPFLKALGRVGGTVHTQPATVDTATDEPTHMGEAVDAGEPGGVDIVVFATLPQVEALRAQLLAAGTELSRLAEEVIAVVNAYHRNGFKVRCGEHTLECGLRPLIMGIVNCTDDSFYEGSRVGGASAVERGQAMVACGADLIDVGGESTRPGSEPVAAEVEIERVVPVIEALAGRLGAPISVDTSKAAVAEAALAAGASMVNDIHGLAADPEIGGVIADAGVPAVLMHMRGFPETMGEASRYQDLIADVVKELRQALVRAHRAGIDPELTLIDPGIGFAKQPQHNYTLLRHLSALRSLGRPIVVGPSRKSFVGAVLDLPPEERLEGTAAAVASAVLAGAHIIRVHDVEAMKRVAAVAAAIRTEGVGWIS